MFKIFFGSLKLSSISKSPKKERLSISEFSNKSKQIINSISY